ncbi:hypothetical protein [Azospirillum thermophilum]|uniref:Phytanoyl-CoA dioxygenase n=1 Tax=Azospirillum thermophilum TaxID=2202148 RepID=A0A2S2D0D5_9PROT|nr:hypothetical protein [Azospirillum thermophilum]AWK90223.1 hypothetical protein DEW08_29870 [Azospirillum thermophilum]
MRITAFLDDVRDRARTRIASPGDYVRKVRQDPRYAIYDILPIVTDPVLRDRLAALIAARRPRTPGFAPSLEARAWCRMLETDGITPAMPPIDAGIVADLRRYFEETPCHDPFRPHLGRFRADAPPSPESNMGYFGVEQILKAPHVLDLFNNPLVLETAELFLGCKPLLDNIGCWWSFGDRPAAKGTQRHHRDLDSLRGFKLFFYLTDVDEDGGPHVFIKGSQRSTLLSTGRALSDEEVRNAFGTAGEVTMTGPAGTWFMGDTYGVHKGALPRRGRRLLLTAQYNINRTPHAPRRPVLDRNAGGYDPFVNQIYVAA